MSKFRWVIRGVYSNIVPEIRLEWSLVHFLRHSIENQETKGATTPRFM